MVTAGVPRDDTRPVWSKATRRITGDVLNVALRPLAALLAEGDDVVRIQPAGIVEHDVLRVGQCAGLPGTSRVQEQRMTIDRHRKGPPPPRRLSPGAWASQRLAQNLG